MRLRDLSRQKLHAMANAELKSAAHYKRLGLMKFAADEFKHASFLKMKATTKGRK